MIRMAAVLAGILALSILVIVLVGYALPVRHVAARAITVHSSPEDVFALISDFPQGPKWRHEVVAVEMLPATNGQVRFREKMKNSAVTMKVLEMNPPRKLITKIDDPSLPFGGAWIMEVSPARSGTRLNITERGEIYNPVFRFVSRFVSGYTGTMDTYLANVARHFGDNALPESGQVGQL